METYNIQVSGPPCYGGGCPGNLLISLNGTMLPFEKIEKVQDSIPQKYKLYIPYLYLDDINLFMLFSFRLRLQVQISTSPMKHERETVSLLSINRVEGEEYIYVEVVSDRRENDRLTDEEVEYIRNH